MRWIVEIGLTGGSEEHAKMGRTAVELNVDGNAARFEQLELAEADMERGGMSVTVGIFDNDDVHGAGQGGAVKLQGRGHGGEELADIGRHVGGASENGCGLSVEHRSGVWMGGGPKGDR